MDNASVGCCASPQPGTPEWFAQLTPKTSLTTEHAGIYLGGREKPLTVRNLEELRSTGRGPKFIRLGKCTVRYRVSDLDEFINQRRVSNTLQAEAV